MNWLFMGMFIFLVISITEAIHACYHAPELPWHD
jgi:hypothetical protein